MKIKEYSFRSASGICDIKAWQYAPDGDVKAVIQIHHGMAEHAGRYKNFIKAFTDMGYAVFIHDMINHGKSNSDMNDLGYFGENNGNKFLTKDAQKVIDIAKMEYPDKKLIISGHSMGSFIMRNYINDFGNHFDAAMFIGTAGPNPMNDFGIALVKMLKSIKGSKYRSKMIYNLSVGPYDKKFERRTKYDWGMRDQQSVDEYCVDPYCGYIFTLGGYLDLFKLLKNCNTKEWYENVSKDIPVLLTSGDEDPVGDFGKGVTHVYNTLVSTGHNAFIKLYPGARHEILNETNKEEVYRDINAWIENNVLNK